ncbi:hypothetical protein GQ600_15008 [Phytophthora cactorum]|nr:hypothetical protein GQ600_15008 [Phytophthora cactorum]
MRKTPKLPHRHVDREVYEDVGDSGNTIGFKFRLTTGLTVSVLKRVLSWRFVIKIERYFIWRIFSEGKGIFSGVSVRPYSDEIKGGTLIEACSRQILVPSITANAKRFDGSRHSRGPCRMQSQEDERELIKALESTILWAILIFETSSETRAIFSCLLLHD